jgi:hypothetical protein
MKTIEDVIDPIRAEYLEMPGLRLRAEQVQRLCGIEQRICQLVLSALVETRFLSANPDGPLCTLDRWRRPAPAIRES